MLFSKIEGKFFFVLLYYFSMSDGLLQQTDPVFEKTYRRSLWLMKHRSFFLNTAFGVWIFFVFSLFFFSGWVFIDSFFVTGKSDLTEVEALIAYGQSERHAFSQSQKARELITAPVSVFPLGDGRYDFAVSIHNPNTDWYATFDYFFSVQGETSEHQKGFILPGEQKPFVFLAYPSQARPARVEV